VSRRERTDRLRRASDGAGPREPAPTEDAAPRERLLPPSSLSPFHCPALPPALPFYFTAATPTPVVDVAAIRQKSGFAVTRPRRNFPWIAPYFSPRLPRPPSPVLFSFSFSFENFRWKNMVFCLRFCIVSKPSGADRKFNNLDAYIPNGTKHVINIIHIKYITNSVKCEASNVVIESSEFNDFD